MMQHRTRLLAAASTAVTAAALAVSGLAAASAATPAASGTEHFQIMTTSSSERAPSTIVATGVFTAGGLDHPGSKADTITFPGGGFKISHSRGHGKQTFNPKTCLFVISQHGTFKVGSGTGKYAGISGHGTYQLSILAVGARTAKGACSKNASPVAWEQVIKASGPVTLK
jgi:hypothetical protein